MATITIDWSKSPRVVVVDSPTVAILQQEIIDLFRAAESTLDALDDDALISGEGKTILDDQGNKVGITNTLLNTLLGFEPDMVSKSQGTATSADAQGRTLVDNTADFVADGVEDGALIINLTDFSVSAVLKVVDQNTIQHYQLSDGTDNQWEIGDAYKIWNIKQCVVYGGNILAVDDNGDVLPSPIYKAPFTQVVIAQSASPTISNLQVLQDALIVATATAEAGSTASSLRTSLSQPDEFFEDMYVMVKSSAGIAVRRIDEHLNLNGELLLDSDLPFTPSVGDDISILTGRGSARGGGGR